jgi:hypothetical protein
MHDAKEQAEEMLRNGDWGDSGGWVEASVVQVDGFGEHVSTEYIHVLLEPTEPPCRENKDHEHDWEDEGVYGGQSGAVVSYDRCAACGMQRATTSGDCNHPGQGNTDGVRYMPAEGGWCRKCKQEGECDCCHEDRDDDE